MREIRTAVPNDLPDWSNMRTDLWPDTDDEHRQELAEFFAGQSIDIVECYVAELKGEMVGFIELNIRSFAEGSRNPRVPYVEAWYVAPEFRGAGHGKALMKQAETWALQQGFQELASDTQVSNHTSIAMHKSMEFIETDRVVCFLKKLKP